MRQRQENPRLKWNDEIFNIIKIIRNNEAAMLIKEAIEVKAKI